MDCYKAFSINLNKYMLKKNKTRIDVSRDLDIPYSTFADWCNGEKYPRIEKLQLLAEYFGVNITDLIEDSSEVAFSSIKIKVYGKISAGIPIAMNENVLGEIEISKTMTRGGKEFFALKVNGNSMEPKFLNGDIVVVEATNNCESGDNCIVAIDNDDATFKKVIKNENSVVLQPLNAEYQPLIFTNNEIKRIKILGIVRELRRKV